MADPALLDGDGYPQEAWLAQLRAWPLEAAEALPAEMARGWLYADLAREVRRGRWVFATVGWSGHEAIVRAARQSLAWRWLGWRAIELPGGLLVVAVTREAAEELEAVFEALTAWAWSEAPWPARPAQEVGDGG
ncbi:MAG TPA: hypothetical protein VNI83_04685 [Vicinamibacterales bacterium]|nr:hypothetical protein [Vicinamibacterales bacterium]